MRKIWIMAASAALGVAGVALAQDAAPPGCKWIGDGVLACKDGKGYWRRSGDDQIVGTYPLAKPKPKPAPAAAASTSAAVVAPAAVAPAAAASIALPAVPEPPPIAAPPEAPMDAALPPVLAPEAAAAPSVAPAVVEAAPDAPKPWWRRWLDSVWHDVQAFLRLFGLGR